MMRARLAGMLAGILLVPAGLPAMAEETPSSEPVWIELPEAGVAVSVPAGWSVDIEMRQREDWGFVIEDDDEPLIVWNVLYASAGGRPWCDLTWYPLHPLSLEEHASLQEELMTPTHADIERPIERSSVALPAGEAQRLVIHNEPTDDWTTTYMLDLVDGRYLLRCASDERADDDWLGLAESLAMPGDATPEASAEPQD